MLWVIMVLIDFLGIVRFLMVDCLNVMFFMFVVFVFEWVIFSIFFEMLKVWMCLI